MEERITEIVAFLIRKMVAEQELETSEDLRTELTRRGYTNEEIAKAFALINNVPSFLRKLASSTSQKQVKRILTPAEKYKLTREAQGYLIELMERKLLSPQETEWLLWQVSRWEAPKIKKEELQWLLAQIIQDPNRLFLAGLTLSGVVGLPSSELQ